MTEDHQNGPERAAQAELTTGHHVTEPAAEHDHSREQNHDRVAELMQHAFRVGDRVTHRLAPEFVMTVLDITTCTDANFHSQRDTDSAGVDSAGVDMVGWHPRLKVLDAQANETWLCSREVRPVEGVMTPAGADDPGSDEPNPGGNSTGGNSTDNPTPQTNSGETGPAPGQPGQNAAAMAARPVHVEYAVVDPRELLLGPNIRIDAALGKEFLASICDRGVQEPVTVRRRGGDGALVVRKGSRRTLAAIETAKSAPSPAKSSAALVTIKPGRARGRRLRRNRRPGARGDRLLHRTAAVGLPPLACGDPPA